jgi:hypothetical protein
MFGGLLFVFCAAAGAYGVWMIMRDMGRGRVSGRGFGFDRASQPARYYALMTFNCLAVALILAGAVFLGTGMIRRSISHCQHGDTTASRACP